MLLPIAIAAGLGLVAAQDVYSCPDGWQKEEDRSGCRCFLIAETEALTRSTADLVCAGHSGACVAELDHPGINYWLKSRLLEAIPPGQYAAFWLGGRATGRHSEHQPGTWTWDHMNTTIEWFPPVEPLDGCVQRTPAWHLDLGSHEHNHRVVRLGRW